MSVIGRIAPGPAVSRFASAVAVDVTEADRLDAIKNYVAGQV
jgi:hypothetical protein